MIRLAITLVHNHTDSDNEAQIVSLASLLTTVEDIHDELDENGNVIGQFSTFHQEVIGLGIVHEVKVFQVIPFGFTPPQSIYKINSGGIVMYGPEDNDKNATRFFNWGLKRGTDNGADISIYLEDPDQLNINKLRGHITAIENRPESVEFIEDTFGKIATVKLLKEVGQLDESKTFGQAVSDLKTRIAGKGLRAA